MPEYWSESAKRKRCVVNLTRLCVMENLPLHNGSWPGFLKFMSKWEPRWPSILKQSVARSVEGQSEQLRKDIRTEMEGVAAETDVACTTDFWTSCRGVGTRVFGVSMTTSSSVCRPDWSRNWQRRSE